MPDRPVYLVSGSPRRQEILSEVVPLYAVINPEPVGDWEEEVMRSTRTPAEIVRTLSFLKAQFGAERIGREGIYIGGDTIVELDGEIFGKPETRSAAFEMLERLSGQTHSVCSGIAIYTLPEGGVVRIHDTTQVEFKNLEEEEIVSYIEEYSPFDKAGAYGIQEVRSRFVRRLEGSYWNVMGFPLERFKACVVRSIIFAKK